MKQLCQTCRHWQPRDRENDARGLCAEITGTYSDPKADPSADDRVSVYDDSDPPSTGCDFGCIHWAGVKLAESEGA